MTAIFTKPGFRTEPRPDIGYALICLYTTEPERIGAFYRVHLRRLGAPLFATLRQVALESGDKWLNEWRRVACLRLDSRPKDLHDGQSCCQHTQRLKKSLFLGKLRTPRARGGSA